ncbi:MULTISPECIES: DUF2069 domain-containing protein [unclassified Guyparkeria]|uniref:DUF2069 domain-containing protein n=1 Tax=unclassified Guyparkeria TaxID=2626246 RepID=UPI0007337930|nr:MULTISPECIES: DUF2069 domain-containing protein [unclassified Guyparkeria]KTG16411.1 hypothetical protein AUR63_03395 [Guyparkeria sp. XI15]OAE85351.1 hypothetical protein AWR35_03400 [Guyparkeria sp. WRN-7]
MRGATTSEGLPLWPLRLMAASLVVVIGGYAFIAIGGQAEIRPGLLTTALLVLPAVAVLPGLWKGHYKTMVWAALFALFYLLVASTDAWAARDDRGWHLLIAVAATVGFLAAWWHSIQRRRTLKGRARRRLAENRSPPNTQPSSNAEDSR